MDWLQPAAREGITGVGVAHLQSFAEPGHALLRRSMSPAFRPNRAAGHFLELIIADRRCRSEPRFEIARFDQVPLTLGVVASDAGETIGLQFHSH